jgi:hypothetical protein
MNTTVKYFAGTMALCGALFCTVGAAQTTTTTTTAKFTEVTSTIYKETGNVKVCFKATGLPIKATTFIAKGTVTATYACRNRGGNCPPGQDTTIKQTVAVSVTHTPDKNGSVSACIWLKVPKADPSTCPDEMALVLKSVSWSGISISDMPNSIGTVYAKPSKQMVNYGSCPAR